MAAVDFDATLARHGVGPLVRTTVTALQINVGKRCNQACHHCHVEAGPTRTEVMGEAVATRVLNLVYTPVGAFLPPPQAELEARYRDELRRGFGIEFHRLFTLTNMPIKRFAEFLARQGQQEVYASLLVNHFNPSTVPGL